MNQEEFRNQPNLYPIDQSDKIYIDNNEEAMPIELPEYGEVRLIIKAGKVVKYDTIYSHIMA